jgi:CRISPR-associated protein Cmr6
MASNTGYLFYKDYYKNIDLRQFDDKERQKAVEKLNVEKFKNKNKRIVSNFPSTEELGLLNQIGTLADVKSKIFITTYPGMLIGSGYIHETGSEGEYKLGAFFDHTAGVPVIPGSSVKGMLRSYFPQFDAAKTDSLLPDIANATEKQKHKAKYIWFLWNNNSLEGFKEEESLKEVYLLEQMVFSGWDTKKLNKDSAKFLPMSLRVIFFDAVPHEFMANQPILADDSITPHGDNPLKNPTPLLLLKVAPEVAFNFYFKMPTKLFDSDEDRSRLLNLFQSLLKEHGVGAKTNVGYGKLSADLPKKMKDRLYQQKKEDLQKGVDENITKEHRAKLQFNEFKETKLTAIIKSENEHLFQFELLDDCQLTKTKSSIFNKLSKDVEKRKRKHKPHNYIELKVGTEVEIRINKPSKPGEINFTVLPKWIN